MSQSGPMRFPIRRTLVVSLCALLLAACGSDSAVQEEPVDEVIEFATTTTSADPWAVPETIDAEYVRRVLQRIDDVRAEVRRDVFATKQFTDADRKKLEAIYTGHKLAVSLNEWATTAPLDHPDFKTNPGNATVAVQHILKASRDCVWANVTYDESANRPSPRTPTQGQIVMVVASHDKSLNPTRWMLKQATVPGQLEPVDACG